MTAMIDPLATGLGVRRLLVAAGAAPSVQNTQPWRFRVTRHQAVALYADPGRRLTVSDPRGRSMYVSCGAALFNLRLAIRCAGYHPVVTPRPGTEPRLLAVAGMVAAGPPTPHESRLYEAIPLRRTNREPFDGAPVPPAALADLRIAASREGACLVPLDRAAVADMLDYAAMAEEELAADPVYLAELARWRLPSYVRGPASAGDPPVTRRFGDRDRTAAFEARPSLAVLTTPGDGPADWLRAGQALQRVLLTATVHGLSASFLNQPLDLRDMRGRTDPRHRRGHPQMIIRLGYGPAVPRAPRRPAADLRTHQA
ncbi:nitroreductase [Sphaerisporangium rubeum]|uniref:Nitroreductase n=1 Tax=Sphaerisporangium rubeum TaxID=321317 RepID=A0A7X0I8X5_9ACTN|nr:nitroreductase family protein [Sphaerisporangium rubeum]MBB6470789.1 nitroreductase [Sphaerisporangium rubeum]